MIKKFTIILTVAALTAGCTNQHQSTLSAATQTIEPNPDVEWPQYSNDSFEKLNYLFGVDAVGYERYANKPEKSSAYYRRMVSKKLIMWGVNGFADDSVYFKEGIWILPYLVEQFDDPKAAMPGLFYPPKIFDTQAQSDLSDTSGSYFYLYASIIKLLYYNKTTLDKDSLELINQISFPDVPKNPNQTPRYPFFEYRTAEGRAITHKIQKQWLLDYCEKYPKSNYCRRELSVFLKKLDARK